MSKQIYISADYSKDSGDRNVVEVLNHWGADNIHKIDFIDMSKVASGSVSKDPDCRPCDLKKEFNKQINASSAVIFIVGDKTAIRAAGNSCLRANNNQFTCTCSPYKQNTNGTKPCKIIHTTIPGEYDNVGNINSYSYLKHEFEQARKKGKHIIIFYNSTRKESNWLPSYMKEYEPIAVPFWIINDIGNKIGNYQYLKKELNYD